RVVTGSTSPKPRAGDPFGVGPVGSWLAPTLSIVGLIVVAFLTVGLLNGSLPFVGGSNGNGNGNGTGNGTGNGQRSPAPADVVIVPEVTFPGSIVYAKAGNIWVQTGKQARQITQGGNDSMPSWSPDGKDVFFI